MVDDVLPGHRGRQAVGMGDVAEDQTAPQGPQVVGGRAIAHQTGDLVAPGRQRGNQVRPDEATCSGH